jgi:hypothetical protein
VADIGLRTTRGVPIPQRTVKASFHQELTVQDCAACHSDHAGAKLSDRSHKPFSHTMLREATRDRCESCHARPDDRVHRDLAVTCGQCHKPEGWKPAAFEHATLAKTALERCGSCHEAPTDSLHGQMQGACGQCHRTQAWKPATFEHGTFFLLDPAHDVRCATCHPGNELRRYTCYGCHAHSPANIRGEHLEEGIRSFDDCVECHRNASGEGGEHGEHGGFGEHGEEGDSD